MQTMENILELARRLSPRERRRLIEELDRIEQEDATEPGEGPYTALLAVAGTAHSTSDDLSTSKYEHLGAGLSEHKQG
jgi:hypothetical protein